MAIRRPEIFGETWLNTPHPITPEEMNGRIVLIDFFTYSCVNCIRTLPFLREIWDRYKLLNFLIIGVHTPEFDFEKKRENVEKALTNFGVTWPVVLDNEYINWNNFANHYWPAKYLIDQNGYIVYEHFGEGGDAETEKKIQELLKENFGIKDFPPVTKNEGTGGFCTIPTPELYCGFQRGRIANDEGYHEDHLGHYVLPEIMPADFIALKGDFTAKEEYVESFGDGGELVLNFNGTEVNLVMEPVGKLASVHLLLDEKEVPKEWTGHDVDQGDVIVTESRMYNLIKADVPLKGILKIQIKDSNIRAYAFTFSGCV